jgi:GT2 family glycosyltransferase
MDDWPDYIFDARFYVATHPDIAEAIKKDSHFDPKGHFYNEGLREARLASLFFNLAYVHHHLAKFEDVEVEPAAATRTFFELPPEQRFVPNRWFNPWAYRQRYAAKCPELSRLNDYATFEHYLAHAGELSLSPSGLFDEATYVARCPDVPALIAAGKFRSGFHHFVSVGWAEDRTNLFAFGEGIFPPKRIGAEQRDYVLNPPSDLRRVVWWFDETFYLTAYPDVHVLQRGGAVRSGLEHFLVQGFMEGRVPHPALHGIRQTEDGPVDLGNYFVILEQQRQGRDTLSLAEASALTRRIVAAGWGQDARTVADALWPFVEAPPINGSCEADRYLAANPDLQDVFGDDQASAAAHWLREGIREQRLAPGSNVFAGRQVLLEDILHGRTGVNFIGPLALANGLGAAARGCVAALQQAGVEVDTYDVSGFVRPGAGFDLFAAEDLRFAINLIYLNADQVLPFTARYGTDVLEHRANVGFWTWELPTPRPEWRAGLSGIDLIVVPSAFCRDSFASFTGRAIEVLPYVVDRGALLAARDAYAGGNPWVERLEAARKAGQRIVLFVADASSSMKRKGDDIFCQLAVQFEREHPGHALFVLKTHSRERSTPPVDTPPSPVLVINEVFDLPTLCKLKSIADVYVSPHRSEGFGLNIFESIMLGVPAFCSDHSGATGMLGSSYPYLLPGRQAEVPADDGPYRRNAVWFEPDPAALFARLERFLDAPGAEREAFEAVAACLAQELSTSSVGTRLRDMLRHRLGLGLDLSAVMGTLSGGRGECFEVGPSTAAAAKSGRIHEVVAAAINPMFSVVTPTFNTKPEWLLELYSDLCSQSEPSWEWCIHDDCSTDPQTCEALAELRRRDARVRVRFGVDNQGIARATNAAVELSCGEYLVLIDHDDRVSPELLRSYHQEINEDGKCSVFYCDEDKLYPDGQYRDHFLKPDWSPEHIMSCMYVLHCLCVKKSLFLELGGYRREFDGAQDHDFVLRVASRGMPIRHVDRVLYHWRVIPGSTSGSSHAKGYAAEAGRKAVAEHISRLGVDAQVEHGLVRGSYRVRPLVRRTKVSLNILTACTAGVVDNRRELYVERFVRSIVRFEYHMDYEIRVIVDAKQVEPAGALAGLDERVKLVTYDRGDTQFNFAAKANFAIRSAAADCVVLLNDDMEALDDEWLPAVVEPLELPGVGVVGGRLVYPDDTLQHSGIALGGLGLSTHVFLHWPKQEVGYNAFTHVIRNYSAVTGALMAFPKSLFTRLGGFDEGYPVDFNDIDFCLRASEAGYRVVYTPFAQLRHFESRSARRSMPDALDGHRFAKRWDPLLRRDPYYNINLRRDTPFFKAIGES